MYFLFNWSALEVRIAQIYMYEFNPSIFLEDMGNVLWGVTIKIFKYIVRTFFKIKTEKQMW